MPRPLWAGYWTNWATSAQALVCGDSGYGNEGILVELESRQQPYLLRLRQTANVQRLVAMAFGRTDWSRPSSRPATSCAPRPTGGALLLRYVSDRDAPIIGPFRPPDALPASR